jgi:hypothetical protein
MLRYVVDGNFSAQHMDIRNKGDDVFLRDGRGFMVSESKYQEHIAASPEPKYVCSCILSPVR